MFHVGPGELIVILLLALIIFGPGKLPEVGRALGRTINEFRRVTRQVEEDINSDGRSADKAPVTAAQGAPSNPAATAASQGGGQAGHVS